MYLYGRLSLHVKSVLNVTVCIRDIVHSEMVDHCSENTVSTGITASLLNVKCMSVSAFTY